ncbi:ammonium transporter, Amt family [Marchantia polymorpha subsp. ruderalis]|uniref:Ammonium transporter n=2 Tax=Marchantia polymorpha TaxID=3197 RepID=A0A176WQ43_MARPO|nr:hypothetical protein AXG93_3823s1020 [Marchantia polymorpha subsp. ruderalis]PTQ34445.1 hypothetical protein MARPO_0080s0061 [Marchantia polymorpha]BBN07258.1 hypothetical protein Mp_4g02370 [Marchantia polymorpha subsp. ruderalis]|eukprot:PTQ34445.1 hypothetical protein MARPO_0080s0061 [Marchantia polymorpha]
MDGSPSGLPIPVAYQNTGRHGTVSLQWLNKGDNAWQMTAATLVGLQCVPGLMILYGSIVKKKWAINSAFMSFYAFAAVLICWVIWGYKMSFGEKLLPFWGKAGPTLGQAYLLQQAQLPATTTPYYPALQPFYPMATLVYFQFVFAALTLILVAGSLLGRMNFIAWMLFVPLWLSFSYSVGAFSLWGGGFLFQWGVIDYAGGYVIHLSSGVAGFVAAYWVGPRNERDRRSFSPNNVLLTLAGAGLLWLGWNGFNGGAPYAANLISPMAVLNTNICAATSLIVWTSIDVLVFKKPSVIGAVQGMITGLVAITPSAGLVQGWAAIVIGIFAGTIPWYTMMVLGRKKSGLLSTVDDTLGAFHTHAVAGTLGGILAGFFAQPTLCNLFLPIPNERGAIYGGSRAGLQLAKQIVGALFVVAWNIVSTTIICMAIQLVVPLRMSEEELAVGDDAAHGEEAYALWDDGDKFDIHVTRHSESVNGASEYDDMPMPHSNIQLQKM